jgi:hypothetical protein
MTHVFKRADLAAREQRRFTPARTRAAMWRGFVRAAPRGSDLRLKHITAERLESARYSDTSALQFDLDTNVARMTAVIVGVRRGRLFGTVAVIGLASEMHVGDVLPLREKLLARLATG